MKQKVTELLDKCIGFLEQGHIFVCPPQNDIGSERLEIYENYSYISEKPLFYIDKIKDEEYAIHFIKRSPFGIPSDEVRLTLYSSVCGDIEKMAKIYELCKEKKQSNAKSRNTFPKTLAVLDRMMAKKIR